MKKYRFLTLSLLAVFLFSACSYGFLKDPRLYGGGKKDNNRNTVTEDPEISTPDGIDAFDMTDKWFNQNQWNLDGSSTVDVTTGGTSEESMAHIRLSAWFDNSNVAYYSMFDGEPWTAGDAAKKEFVYSGANTTGQGYSITGVKYYRYDGINPMYETSGSYNVQLAKTSSGNPKLERFYFFRFTGKGGGIASLDNMLFALDTYSKMIFPFAKPVSFSSMGAPTAWAPVDNVPQQDGITHPFYECDPAGYVMRTDDGKYEVVLYKWFTDNLAAGNYDASMGLSNEATKTPDGAGRSPFNVNGADFFVENMKQIKEYTDKNPYVGWGDNGRIMKYRITSDDGYTTIEVTTHDVSNDSQTGTLTLTHKEHSNATEAVYTGSDGKTYNLTIKDELAALHFNVFENDGTPFALYDAYKDGVDTSLGSDFRTRVQGKTFVYRNDYNNAELVFSADGKTLTDTHDGTVYVLSSVDTTNHTQAKYKVQNGSYYYPLRLEENDTVLTWGTGFSVESWVSYGTCGNYPADLKREKTDSFVENVKGRTYSIRGNNGESQEGGENLYSLSFTDDGQKVFFTVTPWREEPSETSEYDLNTENEGGLTAVYGSLSFTLSEDLETLTVAGLDSAYPTEYKFKYQDKGPDFYYRVKNAVFRYDSDYDNAYVFFSADGKQFTDTHDGLVYTFEKLTKTEMGEVHAGYRNTKDDYYTMQLVGAQENGQQLSYGGGYKMSRVGSFTDALNDTSWYYRDYSDYKFRGTEHIDNVAPGYKSTGISKTLHTYTFKGSTLEYVQTVYREAGEKVRKSYNFVSADGPVGTYTDGTGAKVTVTVKHNSIVVSENGKNYEYSKTDYGPIFVDRVAGAVFQKGNIRYEFSEDGLSFDFWYNGNFSKPADEHYTFARFDNSMENHNKAVYYHYKFAGINYWPVQFTKDNDDVIYKSSGAGAIGTPGTGTILGNPATRQP